MEADLDKDEVIKPEPGRGQGDRLLLSQYTISDKKSRVSSAIASSIKRLVQYPLIYKDSLL